MKTQILVLYIVTSYTLNAMQQSKRQKLSSVSVCTEQKSPQSEQHPKIIVTNCVSDETDKDALWHDNNFVYACFNGHKAATSYRGTLLAKHLTTEGNLIVVTKVMAKIVSVLTKKIVSQIEVDGQENESLAISENGKFLLIKDLRNKNKLLVVTHEDALCAPEDAIIADLALSRLTLPVSLMINVQNFLVFNKNNTKVAISCIDIALNQSCWCIYSIEEEKLLTIIPTSAIINFDDNDIIYDDKGNSYQF